MAAVLAPVRRPGKVTNEQDQGMGLERVAHKQTAAKGGNEGFARTGADHTRAQTVLMLGDKPFVRCLWAVILTPKQVHPQRCAGTVMLHQWSILGMQVGA